MAYFMLDILFLVGDPRQSTTLLDDPKNNGFYRVNEPIPDFQNYTKLPVDANLESLVRIDRTSQLLLCMSIAIAEFVKKDYLSNSSTGEKICQLSDFEEIVSKTVIDK